jgi:addiction module HigA family antidote
MSRSKDLKPTHPGEVLREDVLPAMGKGKAEIARMLGVSRQTLYDILNEVKPVTPQMALRLGKLFGNGPEIWLRLQVNYDLAVQAIALAPELGKIPTLKAA